MLFLSNDLHERASQNVKISRDDILISRTIYNLPSCYNIAFVLHKKMHLSSADYKRVISSYILLWW